MAIVIVTLATVALSADVSTMTGITATTAPFCELYIALERKRLNIDSKQHFVTSVLIWVMKWIANLITISIPSGIAQSQNLY